MEKRADDEFIDDIQLYSNTIYKTIRDIPDHILITVLRIRGYQGQLWAKPAKWIPIHHKNGEVTMKWTTKY